MTFNNESAATSDQRLRCIEGLVVATIGQKLVTNVLRIEGRSAQEWGSKCSRENVFQTNEELFDLDIWFVRAPANACNANLA